MPVCMLRSAAVVDLDDDEPEAEPSNALLEPHAQGAAQAAEMALFNWQQQQRLLLLRQQQLAMQQSALVEGGRGRGGGSGGRGGGRGGGGRGSGASGVSGGSGQTCSYSGGRLLSAEETIQMHVRSTVNSLITRLEAIEAREKALKAKAMAKLEDKARPGPAATRAQLLRESRGRLSTTVEAFCHEQRRR
eukprot:1296911-Pleurochrysis_carterae.AAC.3